MLNSNIKKIIVLTLLLKVILLFVPFLAFQFGRFWREGYGVNFFVYPRGEPLGWYTAYKTWDGFHFLYLADKGYVKGFLSNAMLPLYPLTIAVLKRLTFASGLVSGLILSNVFSLLAFIYLYRFVKKLYNPSVAFRTVCYALAFPTSFYFTRVYSESLFLLLAVLFIYYLYKDRICLAAVFAFLLPLTRMVGVLAIFPFVVHFFVKNRGATESQKRIGWKFLLVLAPVAGLGCSMLAMRILTGNWFEHFDAQRLYVAEQSILNIFQLKKWFLENFVYINLRLHGDTYSLVDRLIFVFYLLSLWLIYRKQDKTLFIYTLVFGMVPALSDHFMSYSRFLIIIFPLYIQMALSVRNHKAVQLAMFICQVLLLIHHSLGHWVA